MFNVIINNEQYDEFMAQKEKIKELEALLDSTYKNYQSALSDKAALIEKLYMKQIIECHELRFENDKRLNELKSIKEADEAIIKERDNLLIKNDELKNKVIRFKELVTENYRLKMSINDLKANNKELKAKINELVGMIKINPYRDWEDAYSPDSNKNINIKNLYITNNYFSEEDENNGDEW